jgi:two-component system, OmpR family, sensor kinase
MSPLGIVRTLIPPALRLPIAAGLMVFVVGVGTTQVALRIENHGQDVHLEVLGQVYLDGLMANVRPYVERGDAREVELRFARAFAEQHGVPERGLFAFGEDGRLIARHGDPSLDADAAASALNGLRIDAAEGIAWVSRPVSETATLVVALDVADILAARTRLLMSVVAVDLVIAFLCGLLAYGILGRMARPIRMLIDHMRSQPPDSPGPLPEQGAAADDETRMLFQAYNRMAEAVSERDRLTRELAMREQAAALGRLAATMAHEVRNPLGGLATAVSTIRRFGEDRQVRDEALGLLERGIETIDRIVGGSLDLYRGADDRPLSRRDLEDLKHLVRPEAERRGVALDWRIDLPDSVDLGAVGVRQVLLNLVLNACAATPPGGRVGLSASLSPDGLVCEVSDEGPGLDRSQAARLTGEGPASQEGSRRLGMDVVVGLLGTLDGRATVSSEPDRGTSIRIAIPLPLRLGPAA